MYWFAMRCLRCYYSRAVQRSLRERVTSTPCCSMLLFGAELSGRCSERKRAHASDLSAVLHYTHRPGHRVRACPVLHSCRRAPASSSAHPVCPVPMHGSGAAFCSAAAAAASLLGTPLDAMPCRAVRWCMCAGHDGHSGRLQADAASPPTSVRFTCYSIPFNPCVVYSIPVHPLTHRHRVRWEWKPRGRPGALGL